VDFAVHYDPAVLGRVVLLNLAQRVCLVLGFLPPPCPSCLAVLSSCRLRERGSGWARKLGAEHGAAREERGGVSWRRLSESPRLVRLSSSCPHRQSKKDPHEAKEGGGPSPRQVAILVHHDG